MKVLITGFDPFGGESINPALEAVKMLKPNVVIPIHYDTWPPIAQSPQDFKIEVEKNCDAKVLIVDFNESIEI